MTNAAALVGINVDATKKDALEQKMRQQRNRVAEAQRDFHDRLLWSEEGHCSKAEMELARKTFAAARQRLEDLEVMIEVRRRNPA